MENMKEFLKKEEGIIILIIFAILVLVVAPFDPFGLTNIILLFFLWLLPFVGVLILGMIAFKMWLHYIQQDFISGIDYVLLEIVPPRDVLRSPQAMELFLSNALYHQSNKGGIEEYWQGAVWFWFSLEIASIDGQVHYYIRTPTRVRGLIETQMYAQFPQAQVKVAEDYTLAVDKITKNSEYNIWGAEFWLKNQDVFPLKTYIDFGLDEDPKEEYKIDPIASVIELFGSIKKGEQMWMQLVIRQDKVKRYHEEGTWRKSHDWVEEGKLQILKKLEPYTGSRSRAPEDPRGGYGKEVRAPGFMDEIIKGAGKKLYKIGFETGIRVCYVAKREVFDMSSRRNMRLIFRQYSNPFSNELERKISTQADAYGTTVFKGFFMASPKIVTKLSDRMLEEYRERAFYYLPLRHHLSSYIPWPLSPYVFPKYFHHKTFILNVEEIATLWHFPGQILRVPTLERIESKEASPPTNLPI